MMYSRDKRRHAIYFILLSWYKHAPVIPASSRTKNQKKKEQRAVLFERLFKKNRSTRSNSLQRAVNTIASSDLYDLIVVLCCSSFMACYCLMIPVDFGSKMVRWNPSFESLFSLRDSGFLLTPCHLSPLLRCLSLTVNAASPGLNKILPL